MDNHISWYHEKQLESYQAPDLTKKQQELLNRYLPESEKF